MYYNFINFIKLFTIITYRKILSFDSFSVRTNKVINIMFLKSAQCKAYVQLREALTITVIYE